jgi:hypothetical protein
MIKLTLEQSQKLMLWSFDRLRAVLADNTYDGDMWFTMDDTIPELKGKLDLNVYDCGNWNGAVRGAVYEVVTGEDGNPQTQPEACFTIGVMYNDPALQ